MANAASGVAVKDECTQLFMDLKKVRKYRWILYKIDTDAMCVVVEQTGAPDETYESLTSKLPENDCRYAVYDYDFEDSEGCKKSKIAFIAWSPDVSKVKQKMLYATSKDNFRRQLDGVHLELQGTDLGEVDIAEIKAKCGSS